MHLQKLHIENFRIFGSCDDKRHLDLDLDKSLNIILGENDSGKSAIIDAIRLLLGSSDNEYLKLCDDDFHCTRDGSRSQSFRIVGHFDGLTAEQAAALLEFITIGKNASGEPTYSLRLCYQATRLESISDNRMGKQYSVSILAGPHESLRVENEARDLLRTTYLKPLRDASLELSSRRNSRLSQILLAHSSIKSEKAAIEKIIKDANELLGINKAVSSQVDSLNSKYLSNLTFGKDNIVAQVGVAESNFKSILEKLELFLVETGLRQVPIHSPAAALPAAALPAAVAVHTMTDGSSDHLLSQDIPAMQVQVEQEIQSRTLDSLPSASSLPANDAPASGGSLLDNTLRTPHGLGLQNLLFMSAELLLLDSAQRLTQLLLIEEPEAHLHPQLQMQLVDFLSQSSRGVQLIMTTHSPTLAAQVDLKAITILNKARAFSLAPGRTELDFDDYEHLRRFLDSTKANLFFARGVLIVEGDAENILIPVLAELSGNSLFRNGISIVKVGHIGLFRYSKIFQPTSGQSMPIKVACVTDIDIPSSNANYLRRQDKITAAKRKEITEERITHRRRFDKHSVSTFIAPNWTLEFELALGPIAKDLFVSIAIAKATKNLSQELPSDKLDAVEQSASKKFDRNVNRQDLAEWIFEPIYKKHISKAVLAQILADRLIAKGKPLSPDVLPPYILDALNHVTSAA
jgi:putative ATP-dependent endonuclease of the OLD family